MRSNEPRPWMVAVCLFAAICGCWHPKAKPAASAPAPVAAPPRELAGTIGEFATLSGTGEIAVQGYGIVVGLGNNGSRSMPAPEIQQYLVEFLSKRGMGNVRGGGPAITPVKFLTDPDTAVVLVAGSAPVGAQPGTKFDLFVRALPGTDARSLSGGILMECDLFVSLEGLARPGGTDRWGVGSGGIFVNPFVDSAKPGQQSKLLEGRVLDGGVLSNARPVRLRLRQPDRARSIVIERRINSRFPEREPVAKAINSGMIEMNVPRAYRDDPEHFVALVMHLPLDTGGEANEVRARDIAKEMQLPGAAHEDMAMTLEAMGREIVPLIQPLYASKSSAAAFYAARTGMRLGDDVAADVLIRMACSAEKGLQVPAITELGKDASLVRAVQPLRGLLDDANDAVRVAAYEALRRHNDRATVVQSDIGGRFKLDLVVSHRDYVIYAKQAGEPRIVLFGQDMPIKKPLFFSAVDDLVVANAAADDKTVRVYRKVSATGRTSDVLQCDLLVRSLVGLLGQKPGSGDHGEFNGLGLHYGQVVSVLQEMCKRGDISAKFVLQELPEVQKLYEQTPTQGRQD